MCGWESVSLCIVLRSSSVNADVSLTASLLSSRHIPGSPAPSPGAHPEAVWVSKHEWALVMFPSIILCTMPIGSYFFDKQGRWKVHVSFCAHTKLCQYSISISQWCRERVHIYVVIEVRSRVECVTHLLASVRIS